jgi:hypothetical protein
MSEPLQDIGQELRRGVDRVGEAGQDAIDFVRDNPAAILLGPAAVAGPSLLPTAIGGPSLLPTAAAVTLGKEVIGAVGDAITPQFPVQEPAAQQAEIDTGSILAAERDSRLRRTSSALQNILARRPLG